MSGSSYDYLCHKLDDPFPQIDPEVAKEMAERLRGEDCADAAEELEAILATRPSRELVELLHAVEWYDSGDWGETRLNNAIEKWRRRGE